MAVCIFYMENIKLVSPPEAHYTVYKLTSPDEKVYIGFTGVRVQDRWDSGWGYKRRTPIREAINHFGWKSFRKEILCEKLTREGAEKLEAWFIEYYDSMNPEKGYNRFTGGDRKGAHASSATIARQRETQLAMCINNPECCRINSESKLAYFRAHPERREKISAQMSAYLRSPEGRKFVEANGKPKPVRCVETGAVFRSQNAAERATGFRGIHKACSGIQTMSGGYHWEYI